MKALTDNKHLLGLIRTVKLYCRYKPRGCEEIISYDMFEEHSKECGICRVCTKDNIIKKDMPNHYLEECQNYKMRCQFCGEEGTRQELTETHKCYQAHCGGKRGGTDFYLTKARIANFGAMKNIFEQLQCAVCRNLMRQPRQCDSQSCENNICSKCIADSMVATGNQCPCCKTKKPKFIEINRVLKNLLVKASIKCISCKKAYPYEEIDSHELHCGKCQLCAAKLSPALSIMQHHVNECQKIEISCINCLRTFKRQKFRTHKCERALTQEEIDKRNEENMLMQRAKQDNLLDEPLLAAKTAQLNAPQKGKWYDDKPVNSGEYANHWKKKTKGCYMLGVGRWFRVCRQNLGKDIESRTKLFQILMMIALGFTTLGLSIYIFDNADYIDSENVGFILAGFCTEFSAGILASSIGYGVLAHKWEGYYNHRFLQTLHCLTLIILSTVIPHGDFLLHLGYRQRGYLPKALEEPFPDGFELQKEFSDYQGYLPSKARGGFNTFFILGYFRCLLVMIRVGLTIGFFYNTDYFWFDTEEWRCIPLVIAILYAYASFNLLMLLKLFFENISMPGCNCLESYFRKRAAKKRNYARMQGVGEEEEDDMII